MKIDDIENLVDTYISLKNRVETLGMLEIKCPKCGALSSVEEMIFCEACGEVTCITCSYLDSEGANLCKQCYDDLLDSEAMLKV